MPLSALPFSIWQLLMSFYFCLWTSACLLLSHGRRQMIINIVPYLPRKLWTSGMTIRRGAFFNQIQQNRRLMFPMQISLSLTSFDWCGLHPPNRKCEYQEALAETALTYAVRSRGSTEFRNLKHRKTTEPLTSMFWFPQKSSLIQQSSVFHLIWLSQVILKPFSSFLSFRKTLLAHFRFFE